MEITSPDKLKNGDSFNLTLTAKDSTPIAFLSDQGSCSVKVSKKAASLSLSASDIKCGEDLIVNVKLSEAINAKVLITIDGDTFNMDLTNGK